MERDSVVSVLDWFQLESGKVVRVVGETRDTLTLEAVESAERFPVRRDPFAVDVREGYVQRVRPRFELVGGDEQAA